MFIVENEDNEMKLTRCFAAYSTNSLKAGEKDLRLSAKNR